MRRRVAFIAAALTVTAVGTQASWGQDVEVAQKGKYRIWYTSSDLKAELDYHWADHHLGDEWLVLKLSVAAGSRGITPVSREAVRIRTPDGHILSLPTQDGFRSELGKLRMALEQENAWGPPASRFVGSLGRSEDWFFSPPGFHFHRETIHPSPFEYCSGPLIFLVPGGVQPGQWTLTIDLAESTVRIPFVLGDER